MAEANINLCEICQTNPPKYTCPQCNIMYCSVPCYKSKEHSTCSEVFYKKCVYDDLTQTKIKDDELPGMSMEMKKMYEILKRMESVDTTNSSITDFDISDIVEEDNNDNSSSCDGDDDNNDEDELQLDSDDEEIDKILERAGTNKTSNFIKFSSDTKLNDGSSSNSQVQKESADSNELADRMKGIDLNDASQIWKALTEAEKREFEHLAQNDGIEPLAPWWEKKFEKKLIQDLDMNNQLKMIGAPEIIEIKNFESITKKSPADCINHNVINVLAAYTYTVRFYNGLHHDFPADAVTTLLNVCGNLKSNTNYDHEYLAVEAVIVNGLAHNLIEDDDDKALIKSDVSAILSGPYAASDKSNLFVLAALSDLYYLLIETKSTANTTDIVKKLGDKNLIKQIIRKIEYYLSFSKKFFNCNN